MPYPTDDRLVRLNTSITTVRRERQAIVDKATRENRDDLTASEDTEFRRLTRELELLTDRRAELQFDADRAASLAQGRPVYGGASTAPRDSGTYRENGDNSYFRDLCSLALDPGSEARDRLQSHAADVAQEQRVAMNRTDGTGGFGVPPLWLMDQYAELARAGRPTADVVMRLPLPGGTDSISIPALLTGSSVAAQTADNTSVSQTDPTDRAVNSAVITLAGQTTLSQQLIDQSPAQGMDRIIFTDLAAALATAVDVQVLSGTGANGQVFGLRNTAGITTLPWVEAAPTVKKLYGVLNSAISATHLARLAPPTAIVMSPRRWSWILNGFDTTDRPLVVPNGAAVNQPGTFGGLASQGPVGTILSLPVIVDASIPTNVNANQDVILIVRALDNILWEGSPQARALPEVLSDTLSVRLQVWEYLAFTGGRFPAATTVLTGTGLTTPTW
jgi:HK97 family phage major capsid protein